AAGGWREHPPCRLSESRTWAMPPFRRCPFYDMRRRDESEPPKRRFEKRKKPAKRAEPGPSNARRGRRSKRKPAFIVPQTARRPHRRRSPGYTGAAGGSSIL